MFSLLLSSTCTMPRPFLLLTPLHQQDAGDAQETGKRHSQESWSHTMWSHAQHTKLEEEGGKGDGVLSPQASYLLHFSLLFRAWLLLSLSQLMTFLTFILLVLFSIPPRESEWVDVRDWVTVKVKPQQPLRQKNIYYCYLEKNPTKTQIMPNLSTSNLSNSVKNRSQMMVMYLDR